MKYFRKIFVRIVCFQRLQRLLRTGNENNFEGFAIRQYEWLQASNSKG